MRRHTRGSLLPFALTGAAMVSMLPIIDDRPWMLTIALFTSLLLVLTHGRNHPRALWLAVPLFWLWANVHIVFVYGLGVMGFAWLDGVVGHILPEADTLWLGGSRAGAGWAARLTPPETATAAP